MSVGGDEIAGFLCDAAPTPAANVKCHLRQSLILPLAPAVACGVASLQMADSFETESFLPAVAGFA